ncbi:YbaB/EbfC family nucleoid-associated protein [Actinoplanes sp. NPDC051470]|uniref:YbaB/EbfC family nucleoid-associated protein n=1 Tax=unclassified Actinoplanes TaxID=2626549 RepID=UPI0034252CB5
MEESRIRRLADSVRAVQQGMAGISARAESPDGLIMVVVGARGELRELRLDPRIYRQPDSRALARGITATLEAATADAQRQVFELVRDLLPAGATAREADLDFDPFLHQVKAFR